MQLFSIEDPDNNRFPFTQEVFEDRMILYHGSWSTLSARIESLGLQSANCTLELTPFKAISDAMGAVGCTSFFSAFTEGPYAKPFSAGQVFFTPSFWGARAYATDAGGELVRMTIKGADWFEQIFNNPKARAGLINRWKQGSQDDPNHGPTLAALAVLENAERLGELAISVRTARASLLEPCKGGYPVVYGIRVDPEWFGNEWEIYLDHWHRLGSAGGELKCRGIVISPERIIARADFPNGTDSYFDPTHITKWTDIPKRP